MSYESRIESVRALIKEHNEVVTNKANIVNVDGFIEYIKSSGGTSEERLLQVSHEDILEFLPEMSLGGKFVKPRILAKSIADIFRKKESTDNTEKRPISAKKVDRMTLRELVEAFDPEDYSNSVGVRLSQISKKEPFIVYLNGRTVDVITTLKLLEEVKQGYSGRTDIDVNGNIKKVYRIGELPENYVDENPLYRNRPLRPDGTCDQTGRSWEGVSLVIRQLIRLAMDSKELSVNIENAHNTLDIALDVDALSKLRKRYRQASIKFDELSKTGGLPTLKIEIKGGSENTNPFDNGKKVIFVGSQLPSKKDNINRYAGLSGSGAEFKWDENTASWINRRNDEKFSW